MKRGWRGFRSPTSLPPSASTPLSATGPDLSRTRGLSKPETLPAVVCRPRAFSFAPSVGPSSLEHGDLRFAAGERALGRWGPLTMDALFTLFFKVLSFMGYLKWKGLSKLASLSHPFIVSLGLTHTRTHTMNPGFILQPRLRLDAHRTMPERPESPSDPGGTPI